MDEVDETLPDGRWSFNEQVTTVFDNMLARSIPQYDIMRALVRTISGAVSAPFPEPAVLDLGCSRGESIAALIEPLGPRATFLGIDASLPMVEASRDRFLGRGNVQIEHMDLRTQFPDFRPTLTLSILTLQFVPLEHRQRVVRAIYHQTSPGGALVVIEKVLGTSERINATMVETYERLKSTNGYTTEQIDRKRASLEGVLVPLTAAWNEDLLRSAGFQDVDCFWRWMNFAGWVAVKS